MTPLIRSLQAKARGQADPVQRRRYEGACAVYLALAGQAEPAQELVRALRREAGQATDLELTAWLCLAEGLHALHAGQAATALDRFRRAHALAACLPGSEVYPLAGGWLAHVEFNFGDYRRSLPLLAEALAACAKDMHAALGRAATTLGDAFLHCRDDDAARVWYARARKVASVIGDTAAIAAVAHNMAAIAVRSLRLDGALGGRAVATARVAPTLFDSSRNLDEMTGIHFLRHYETWVQVQLLILQQRHREAYETIGGHLAAWRASGPQRYCVQAEADALLCRAALGLALAPGEVDAWAASVDLDRCDPDDAALVYLALAEALDRLGEDAKAVPMREHARAAYGQHLELAAGLLAELNREGLSPREWDDLYGAA